MDRAILIPPIIKCKRYPTRLGFLKSSLDSFITPPSRRPESHDRETGDANSDDKIVVPIDPSSSTREPCKVLPVSGI